VLRLSAVTFDDGIKQRVVRNPTSCQTIKAIISAAKMPRVMLMCFERDQLIDDLTQLNAIKPDGVRVLISIMFYTLSYPRDIQEMADRSYLCFRKVIEYLVWHQREFENLVELRFLYPPSAYAWRYRDWIAYSIRTAQSGDIVLSSRAAYPVVRSMCASRVKVFPISNPAGGTIDFATTLTTRAVTQSIKGLITSGHCFKKVYIPNSIWWARGEYDMEASCIGDLMNRWPEVIFHPVNVPVSILDTNLSLGECYSFLRVEPRLLDLADQDRYLQDAARAAR
jgi:hypothetical protein